MRATTTGQTISFAPGSGIHKPSTFLFLLNPFQKESALELTDIEKIVEMMERSSLTEFELQDEEFRLRICRRGQEVTISQPAIQGFTSAQMPAGNAPVQGLDSSERSGNGAAEGKLIKSPMVGTFYIAPSPDSPPFVQMGDQVTEESVVCIIEAMKVMNEIKAEMSGKILDILAANGESVEYGQPLFRLG